MDEKLAMCIYFNPALLPQAGFGRIWRYPVIPRHGFTVKYEPNFEHFEFPAKSLNKKIKFGYGSEFCSPS